jgi:diacylglycerol kinase family enzyme
VTPHLEEAVRVVVDHHTVGMDVAEVNGRVFVNNSGLGIYPHIVALREAEQHCHFSGDWTPKLRSWA